MSGIKTINPANPGLKRPFRLSDLQNVWDGLTEALASETLNSATPLKIVSGLHIIGGILTPGVIAYKGKLFYYEGATSDNGGFSEGNDMYVATIDDDNRTLSTGLVQPFYINNVIRNSKVNSGAILLLTNVTEVALSRFRYIPSVDGDAIVSNTITRDKIADGAVGNAQIAEGSVTPIKCDAAPFVRSGATLYVGHCYIGATGLFIVTLKGSKTDIKFGPTIAGVVHVIVRNTTDRDITVCLYGPTASASLGEFSAPAGTRYAITTRANTGKLDMVVEVKKLDFFQTSPAILG